MRWILIVVVVLVVAAAAVAVVGALLPRDHVASTSADIAARPEDVWRTITDVEQFPTWRAVTRVDVLEPIGGKRHWREVSRFGPITFESVEERAPQRFVSRIVDTDQGFGGTWTWEIAPAPAPAPDGARSRVTITERGWVGNPLFRFMSRFVFGHHATQEEYLRALGRRFGSDVTPTRG
jgi:uncharacterized protein YndB with AHSA1/START domain